MTHLFLILILSISIGHANENTSEEVIKSVKLNDFVCTKQKLESCSYTECTGTLGSYPRPILITIPETINALKLHFHGHILGLSYSKPYEGNLTSMTKAFKIQSSLCKSSAATVFPQSTGANTTYKEYFKDNESYTKFFSDLHATMGNNLKGASLYLSGHSGGGKYIAGALSAGINPFQISVFDGIYSKSTKDALKDWYNKGEGKLTLATVRGMDPDKLSNELRTEIGTTFTSTITTINGTNYNMHKSDRVNHYCRAYSEIAHFKIVTDIWPGTN